MALCGRDRRRGRHISLLGGTHVVTKWRMLSKEVDKLAVTCGRVEVIIEIGVPVVRPRIAKKGPSRGGIARYCCLRPQGGVPPRVRSLANSTSVSADRGIAVVIFILFVLNGV